MTARHRAEHPRGESTWLALLCACAVLAVLVSRAHPPADVSLFWRSQAQALVRVVLTCVVGVAAMLGPGLVLRARWGRCQGLPLGFVPVPGLACLIIIGGACWLGAARIDPHDTSQLLLLVVLAVTGAAAWGAGPMVDHEEVRVLALAALVLAFGVGRALWSQGPDGELYAGTISRTLEVGDRPDSRISYHVTTLVAHGLAPYGDVSSSLFAPYSFLDRGPLPGVASSALMLAMGTDPSDGLPDQPWSVFDVQGFMVYRTAMMLMALMALLAVFSLVRGVSGPGRARLAAVLTATTPFFIHEVYFTWPKLVASAFCLLAAHAVLSRRSVTAGALVGVGYLMHPLALLTVPTLGLLVLFLELRAGPGAWWRPRTLVRILGSGARLGVGTLIVVATWRGINWGRPERGSFIGYVFDADAQNAHSFGEWISSRSTSVANTLIPFYRLLDTSDPSINSIYAPSDETVHFFFQYWTGVPFGVGIVFFPFLLVGLARAARSAPACFLAFVVVPFVVFAIYWGSYDSGLMREGLHPWVLTLLVVFALVWPGRSSDGRVGTPTQTAMALRLVGTLAWAVAPTRSYRHEFVGAGHGLGDVSALLAMTTAAVALAWIVTRRGESLEPVGVDVIGAHRRL